MSCPWAHPIPWPAAPGHLHCRPVSKHFSSVFSQDQDPQQWGQPHHKRTGCTEGSGVHCSKSREWNRERDGFDSIWGFSQNSNAKDPTLQTAGSFPLGNQQTSIGLSQVPGAVFPQETKKAIGLAKRSVLRRTTLPPAPKTQPGPSAHGLCICPRPFPSSLYLRQKDPTHILPAHPRGHSHPLLEKPPSPAFSSSS